MYKKVMVSIFEVSCMYWVIQSFCTIIKEVVGYTHFVYGVWDGNFSCCIEGISVLISGLETMLQM